MFIAGVQGKIPTFIVEVTDKDTIKNTAIKAKIILNCVGPNTIFSGKIIEACIESGTHYIDMSAEINVSLFKMQCALGSKLLFPFWILDT